jgi:hypothetical protein
MRFACLYLPALIVPLFMADSSFGTLFGGCLTSSDCPLLSTFFRQQYVFVKAVVGVDATTVADFFIFQSAICAAFAANAALLLSAMASVIVDSVDGALEHKYEKLKVRLRGRVAIRSLGVILFGGAAVFVTVDIRFVHDTLLLRMLQPIPVRYYILFLSEVAIIGTYFLAMGLCMLSAVVADAVVHALGRNRS